MSSSFHARHHRPSTSIPWSPSSHLGRPSKSGSRTKTRTSTGSIRKETHQHRARELRPKFDLATRRSFPRRRPHPRPRRQLTGKKLGDLKKPLPKMILPTRSGSPSSQIMNIAPKPPGFSKICPGPGAFPAETLPTAMPNHRLRPSFPRNPLSPPSAPVQGRLQAPPSKSNFLAVCILATLSFASLVSLSSCTLKATGYPASGPAAKNNEVIQAKFTWAGGGSGGVKVTMGDGEICKGRYATVVGGVISSEAATNAPAGWAAQATSGGVRGLQTSRAMLMGDRGRILDFEGYTSGANPTHGFGIAKDNRGSTWKLIW